MNGPRASRANTPVNVSQVLSGRVRVHHATPAIVSSATQGIEATLSWKPTSIDETHSNVHPPKSGCSGFGAKNASRSTPGALLRHSTRGLIQFRWANGDPAAVSTGVRSAVHTRPATTAASA